MFEAARYLSSVRDDDAEAVADATSEVSANNSILRPCHRRSSLEVGQMQARREVTAREQSL